MRGEEARRRLAGLTAREREVLALLGEGLSKRAGARLHMSEATVKTYVSRVLTKLDCHDRDQAAPWPATRAWSRAQSEPQRSGKPYVERISELTLRDEPREPDYPDSEVLLTIVNAVRRDATRAWSTTATATDAVPARAPFRCRRIPAGSGRSAPVRAELHVDLVGFRNGL
ncbi:hypothetical protein SVIOM342S_04081 [Streptomyces violaceorubidus]